MSRSLSSNSLCFVSRNQHKLSEAKWILEPHGVTVLPVTRDIKELQTQDPKELVRDKALKAFRDLGMPLFVEHTGLHLDYLNGLPGGLTQIFWERLQADRFTQLFGASGGKVTARTVIGYIDGERCHYFEGEIDGTIPPEPRGKRDFQWDCVFLPTGWDKTFAELGDLKNEISMRRKALDKFSAFLKERPR